MDNGQRITNGGNGLQATKDGDKVKKGVRSNRGNKSRGISQGLTMGGYPCTDSAGQNEFGNHSQIKKPVLTQSFKTIVRQ